MGTWSVVLPNHRLYTVRAPNYVCAIGQALARTGAPQPWGPLVFERLGDDDGMAHDLGSGARIRAHRSARVLAVVYEPARVRVTAAA